MQVTILNTSHDRPLSFIGKVAGISHGKDDESVKRALGCWRAGHGSVLEHVSVTFKADGISRACNRCGARGGRVFTEPLAYDIDPRCSWADDYRAEADSKWNRRGGERDE